MLLDELQDKVINWHQVPSPHIDSSHINSTHINNQPNGQSLAAIKDLCTHILIPIQQQFGEVKVTYGFVSHGLLKQIQRESPQHIAPRLDQHSAYELNSKGTPICFRAGVACDIHVTGYENNMYQVAYWCAETLPFDRMYLYGNNRPIHVSYGPDHSRFIQMMNTGPTGKRAPGKRGDNTQFGAITGYPHEP